MKIHFNNCNFSSASGPNSFASRLAEELSIQGHVIADANDYDIALVFIEPNGKLLQNKPIVQRLDGIWFRPEEFGPKNQLIKKTYATVDYVIWQSDFDRQMTTKWWGNPKSGSVIRNGINARRVEVKTETLLELHKRYQQVFVCSSNWHPQKRLFDNIELFKHLRATKYPYSCLIVMGHGPDHLVSDMNIYYTGVLPHETCLEVFATADWMIHLAWLDHCPNVVVEALSQGTPVICAEAGGTKELVGQNGLVLRERDKYDFELTNYDAPPRIDVSQVTSLPEIPTFSDPEIDIKNVARRYVDVFEQITK